MGYDTNKYKGGISAALTWNDALRTSHLVENNPVSLEIERNIKDTAQHFQKIKNILSGFEVIISSWYRCQSLNKIVGGSDTSGHLKGFCIDFETKGIDLEQAFNMIQQNGIRYDELYLEKDLIKKTKWIHINFDPRMRWKTGTAVNGVFNIHFRTK